MAIRALTQLEFETLASTIHGAVEWFADDANAVLGIIIHYPFDRVWSFQILRLDHSDTFSLYDFDAGSSNADEARRALVEKMETAARPKSSTGRLLIFASH
jgi:hypothetical protein